MYEHNEPSEGFLVVNLSSDEEDVVPYTSRDEDLARKLSVTSIVVFLGRPMTTTLSSSATLKKRRCARMTTLMPMLRHLLLGSPRLYPHPPLITMMHSMGCKMIVVMVAHPIGCKMIVVMVKMEPTLLSLPHQRG
jgi:hypothetical protein